MNPNVVLAYLKVRVEAKAREISARELGKRAGLTEVTIHHIREGKRGIGPRAFYNLIHAIGETPASLEALAREWATQHPGMAHPAKTPTIPPDYPTPLRRWLEEHRDQDPASPEVAAIAAQMRASPSAIALDDIGSKLDQAKRALGLVGIASIGVHAPEPAPPKKLRGPAAPRGRRTGTRLVRGSGASSGKKRSATEK